MKMVSVNGKQNAFVRKFEQVYIEQVVVDPIYEEVLESATNSY
jgi:hypothetical protein